MIVSKRYCLVTLTTPMIPWMMHPLKSNRWIHLEGLTSGWICKASRPRRHLKWLHWNYWAGFSLVVSAQLKNISQNGNLPQIEVKIKKYVKSPPSYWVGLFGLFDWKVSIKWWFDWKVSIKWWFDWKVSIKWLFHWKVSTIETLLDSVDSLLPNWYITYSY